MTSTDPTVPARCTCPHFENEHEEGGGPCRATTVDLSVPVTDPAGITRCTCPRFTPRDEPARRRAATETRTGERLPEQISGRVLAIRDRAREAGRIITAEQQTTLDRTRLEEQQRRTKDAATARHRTVVDTIPTRFRDAQVTHPDVLAWTLDVAAGSRDSLVILGPTGTGKTYEAFGAWATLVRDGYGVGAWATTPDLLDSLRPGREQRAELREYQAADLLLLDDLAVERGSDWTIEVLYRLLDHRYAWCLPTIVTTNVVPSEVRERLGDRIASRLNGMGRTVVLEGEDRRTPRRGNP